MEDSVDSFIQSLLGTPFNFILGYKIEEGGPSSTLTVQNKNISYRSVTTLRKYITTGFESQFR